MYEIALNHQKVSEANVFVNKAGVTDADLCNKIRGTIIRNKDAVKDFLLSEEIELHLEFLPKINRRKRSGLDSIFFLSNKIYKLKILNSNEALETPHVPRRVQRIETRGLEKLCKGDCEELKAAKQEIARLEEENGLLRAKLDRVNEDLRQSQEAQMTQNLRHR